MLAVLGNVLAAALCQMPSKAPGLFDDVLGAMSICASGGAAHDGGGTAPDKGSGHCTACTLLAGLALAMALAFAAVLFPARIIAPPLGSGLRTLADHLALGGIRSRAPPACA